MDHSYNVVSKRLFWSVTAVGAVVVSVMIGAIVFLYGRSDGETALRVVEPVQLGRSPASPAIDSSISRVDADRLSALFKVAAEEVKDAVVFIQVETKAESAEDGIWEHRFLRRGPRQSVGSGVILSADGYVVTNNHVVESASSITVTLTDKRQYEAEVVGLDPFTDLAVLRVENGKGLPTAKLGDSDQVQVGQWVLAVGNPFRLTSTVTAGIVSALSRQVNVIGDSFGIEDFIQTDAAINPGNSGGALVDLSGSLIGINTAIATESGSYEGYGFAVPSNLALRVVSDLIEYGEVQRGYLGVEIREVNAMLANRIGLQEIAGVYLHEVWRGGAADRAGLRIGDVVVSVEGQVVNAPNELQSAIARQRPGDHVRIEVWRRGSRQSFDVVLMGREDPAAETWFADLSSQRPESPPTLPELPPDHPEVDVTHLDLLGIGVRDAYDRDLRRFDVGEGVYVAYVDRRGPAAAAGLGRDVLILSVDSRPVASVAELQDAVDRPVDDEEGMVVEVMRPDGVAAFYEVDLD